VSDTILNTGDDDRREIVAPTYTVLATFDPSCDGAAVCADHGWREVERLHAELVAAHARIDVLSELLGDLLNDCDNWGIVPHTRYEEALA